MAGMRCRSPDCILAEPGRAQARASPAAPGGWPPKRRSHREQSDGYDHVSTNHLDLSARRAYDAGRALYLERHPRRRNGADLRAQLELRWACEPPRLAG